MRKVKQSFLQSMVLGFVAFLFGASYLTNAYAIDLNDYALDVQVRSTGNDTEGIIPVFVVVTYAGAGVELLTAENFSINTEAQMVPAISPGCSTLMLDTGAFRNKGDGVYHLGLKPLTSFCGGTYFIPIKVDMRSGHGIKASGMAVLEVFRFSLNLN